MSRRTLTNNKIRLMLLTLLLVCSINMTPRQRLDSRHNNRTRAVAPTLVSASQISSGGLIAFTAANQIYVMNADGSNVRLITDGVPQMAYDYPTFSPDGSRIAFISHELNSHQYALEIVGTDGSFWQRLISGRATLGELAWSPDGSKIAFARGEDNTTNGFAFKLSCRPEIYVINIFSRRYVDLTQGAGGTDPAWSPDGTRIAFSSFRDDNNSEIYTMSSDGNDVQRLTYTEGGEAEPAWSPDGKQVAYAAHLRQVEVGCGFIPMGRPPDTKTDPSYIYVMDLDGANQTKLEITSGGNEPTWSPDGAWLAFVIADKNGRQVYVTGASGSGLTQLTSDTEEKSSLSWSNASN